MVVVIFFIFFFFFNQGYDNFYCELSLLYEYVRKCYGYLLKKRITTNEKMLTFVTGKGHCGKRKGKKQFLRARCRK